MDKRINKIILDFISKVAEQNPRLVTTYLFGSFAKDKNRTESDIDIALFIDDLDDKEKFDLQVQLMILATKFDSRIEPHPISNSDINSNNPFISEILKTGIEINPRMPNNS